LKCDSKKNLQMGRLAVLEGIDEAENVTLDGSGGVASDALAHAMRFQYLRLRSVGLTAAQAQNALAYAVQKNLINRYGEDFIRYIPDAFFNQNTLAGGGGVSGLGIINAIAPRAVLDPEKLRVRDISRRIGELVREIPRFRSRESKQVRQNRINRLKDIDKQRADAVAELDRLRAAGQIVQRQHEEAYERIHAQEIDLPREQVTGGAAFIRQINLKQVLQLGAQVANLVVPGSGVAIAAGIEAGDRVLKGDLQGAVAAAAVSAQAAGLPVASTAQAVNTTIQNAQTQAQQALASIQNVVTGGQASVNQMNQNINAMIQTGQGDAIRRELEKVKLPAATLTPQAAASIVQSVPDSFGELIPPVGAASPPMGGRVPVKTASFGGSRGLLVVGGLALVGGVVFLTSKK
jgi:hypothetical protein